MQYLRSEEEMAELLKRREVVEEEIEEVGLRKAWSQKHKATATETATAAAVAVFNAVTTTAAAAAAAAAELGGERIEEEVTFEETIDLENGKGMSSFLSLQAFNSWIL